MCDEFERGHEFEKILSRALFAGLYSQEEGTEPSEIETRAWYDVEKNLIENGDLEQKQTTYKPAF